MTSCRRSSAAAGLYDLGYALEREINAAAVTKISGDSILELSILGKSLELVGDVRAYFRWSFCDFRSSPSHRAPSGRAKMLWLTAISGRSVVLAEISDTKVSSFLIVNWRVSKIYVIIQSNNI